jgi:hypothetical protein
VVERWTTKCPKPERRIFAVSPKPSGPKGPRPIRYPPQGSAPPLSSRIRAVCGWSRGTSWGRIAVIRSPPHPCDARVRGSPAPMTAGRNSSALADSKREAAIPEALGQTGCVCHPRSSRKQALRPSRLPSISRPICRRWHLERRERDLHSAKNEPRSPPPRIFQATRRLRRPRWLLAKPTAAAPATMLYPASWPSGTPSLLCRNLRGGGRRLDRIRFQGDDMRGDDTSDPSADRPWSEMDLFDSPTVSGLASLLTKHCKAC